MACGIDGPWGARVAKQAANAGAWLLMQARWPRLHSLNTIAAQRNPLAALQPQCWGRVPSVLTRLRVTSYAAKPQPPTSKSLPHHTHTHAHQHPSLSHTHTYTAPPTCATAMMRCSTRTTLAAMVALPMASGCKPSSKAASASSLSSATGWATTPACTPGAKQYRIVRNGPSGRGPGLGGQVIPHTNQPGGRPSCDRARATALSMRQWQAQPVASSLGLTVILGAPGQSLPGPAGPTLSHPGRQ